MSTSFSPEQCPALRPVALIAGPTASGKSDLAVGLGQEIERLGAKTGTRARIINADSAQVYADLAILSARPSPDDMRGVEHRLFGAWDGANPCSAADWARAAKREIASAHRAGAVPILVGGTGLYIRTLLDGIAPVPPIDTRVREAVRTLATQDAWEALSREDPARAALLSPTDSARVARSLEVVRATGRSLHHWQQRKEGGISEQVDLHPLILLPEREALYARCDARFARMVELGACEEVERLLARELAPELPVMRAIGVRAITGWIAGHWTRGEAIEQGAQATRNYAKRQYTWFRRQPPAGWPSSPVKGCEIKGQFAPLLRILGLT